MTDDTTPIAREGYPILFASWLAAMFAFLLHAYAGAALALWAVFCVCFFRNPRRTSPPEGLLAPADGRVIFCGRSVEPDFLKRETNKISIFMSPFNVHVNRAPETGVVRELAYRAGKFLGAFSPRASELNERSAVRLVTDAGHDIVFVQVAGWFARRIVTYARPGSTLTRGCIFGLIKFGSRMDVYFPDAFIPRASVGDRVRAGESVIAGVEELSKVYDKAHPKS